MFKRSISVQRKNTQPIMTHVTLPLRRAVEKLARKENISISELSRRSIMEFMAAKNTEEQVEP